MVIINNFVLHYSLQTSLERCVDSEPTATDHAPGVLPLGLARVYCMSGHDSTVSLWPHISSWIESFFMCLEKWQCSPQQKYIKIGLYRKTNLSKHSAWEWNPGPQDRRLTLASSQMDPCGFGSLSSLSPLLIYGQDHLISIFFVLHIPYLKLAWSLAGCSRLMLQWEGHAVWSSLNHCPALNTTTMKEYLC